MRNIDERLFYSEKMIYEWQNAGLHLSALEENKLIEITLGDRRIGLLKRGENTYAFTAACPHAGAPLCDGWVDAMGRIVCPEHKYRFDPANGRNTSGEGYKLFTYPVEVREGGIFIGLPASP